MLYVEERDRPAILDYDPVARNSGIAFYEGEESHRVINSNIETANEMA